MSEGTIEFPDPDSLDKYIVSFDTASECTEDGWFMMAFWRDRHGVTALSPRCRTYRWLEREAKRIALGRG